LVLDAYNSVNMSFNRPITPHTNPEIKTRLKSPRKIARYLGFVDLSKIENNFEREIMISMFSKNTILEKLQHQIL